MQKHSERGLCYRSNSSKCLLKQAGSVLIKDRIKNKQPERPALGPVDALCRRACRRLCRFWPVNCIF